MDGFGRRSRQALLSAVAMALALLLAGCATQAPSVLQSTQLPRRVELSATPFFPQERYQCGPAALATVLQAAGISAMPEALVPQVYVPQRNGSFPPEMLAAGRRNGALSMAIAPRLDALLAELAAGNPVIVLQNLGLAWFPLWHYAVAIGYDLDSAEIILRSGTTSRETMRMATFDRTWARGDRWAMLALPPTRLPATVQEEAAVRALVAFEQSADAARAREAYATALRRWPQNLALQLGYGNAAYAGGDRRAAADAFRHAAQQHPASVPAFNNLATVLAELGDFEQARAAAAHAVALGGVWRDEAQATLRAIDSMQRAIRRDAAGPH